MKKYSICFLFVILLLLQGGLAKAGPVTRQQAQSKAEAFMKSKGKSMKKMVSASRRGAQKDPVGQETYYVFNVGNSEGFVIVSGDDRTGEILGYADRGEMDMANLPSNVKAWLDRYDREIRSLGDAKVNNTPRMSNAAIPYLIKTQWSQREPYNLLCPIEPNSNKRCITGCVATAMAQVLNYYKYPKNEIPAIPAYNVRDDFSVDALEATTINWENMSLRYDASDTDASAMEVAKLMRYCGQLVNMGYSPYGSGAYTGNILKLKDWGYKEGASVAYRNDFASQEDWENRIYDELKAGRPVLYSGNNQNATSGHQFICDGYDGDGLFHMNWGWGGYCDGNFVLTALNPSGDDYNFSQDAIINLQPNDGSMPEIGEEGTEFDATTTDGITMHFVITYDTSSKRTCAVSRYVNDDSYNRAIDVNYDGSVTIPSEVVYNGKTFTVTEISNNVFEDCRMTSLSIPPTVIKIGSYAISWCNQLSSLEIPASVTSIAPTALYYTNVNLTSLTVASENQKFDSRDNCNAIIQTDQNKLVVGSINTVIPPSVTEIGERAFEGISGLKINIPTTVSTIGSQAFAYCRTATITSNYSSEELLSVVVANSAFDGASGSNMVLKVPAGTKDAYFNAVGWNAFPLENIYEGDEGTEFTTMMNGVSMTFTITSVSNKTVKVGYAAGDSEHTAISRNTQNATITVDQTVNYNGVDYTITAIGAYAFYDIYNMRQIVLPATVKTIGKSAFEDCYNLTSFELPAGVKSFEYDILRYCSGLTSLSVASDNTAFFSVEKSNVIIERGTNKLVLGIKSSVIPEVVTEIGERAFEGISGLKINIPTTVKAIDYYAFAYCSSAIITALYEDLSEIKVDEWAFNGAAYNNMTLRVPAGKKDLYKNATGWSAFAENQILEGNAGTEFTATVSGVDMVFTITSDTSDEKTVKVGHLSGNWNDKAIDPATEQPVVTIPETVTYNNVEYTVTAIGDYAFNNIWYIQQIKMPETIETIGNSAIRNCENLTSIEIPAKVSSIGRNFLGNCSNLTSLTVAADNSVYESRGCNVIIEKATKKLILGTKVGTIPADVAVIGAQSFSSIDGLHVTIPASVTAIEDYAFAWCYGSVFTVESATPLEIRESVFDDTSKNNCILRVPAGAKNAYLAAKGWKEFGEENIFEGNNGLEFTEEVAVGDDATIGMTFTVTNDGDQKEVKVGALAGTWENTAVSKSITVTSIKVPEIVTHDGVEYTVTAIGAYAFYGLESLEQLELPASITSIGDYAFSNCYSLTGIEIPAKVSKIGSYVFNYAGSLVSLTVAEGNEYFEAPDGCNALIDKKSHKLIKGTRGTTSIPSSVTEIGDEAFINVGDLRLTIPKSVKKIAYNAFGWCGSSVFTVEYNADELNTIEVADNAFQGARTNNSVLKVPTGTKDAYLAATGWNQFKPENVLEGNAGEEFTEKVKAKIWNSKTDEFTDEDIDMIFTVTGSDGTNQTVKVGPLSGDYSNNAINVSLGNGSEIEIPEFITHDEVKYHITAIGNYAFRGKSFFSKITLPNSVMSIGESAFQDCYNLKAFVIPENVTTIGEGAFRWVSNVVLSVADGNPVFDSRDNCNAVIETATNTLIIGSLATKEIPSSVSSIGSYAFYNVNSLDLLIPKGVTYIGSNAFAFCHNSLFTVESKTPAVIDGNAFYGAQNNNIILKVPAGCKEAYLAATGWNRFQRSNVYEGNEGEEFTETVNGVDMIFTVTNASQTNPQVKVGHLKGDWGNPAISKKTLGEVVIPAAVEHNGVTYQVSAIGDYAFNTVNISAVTLPGTITEIGFYAFADCYNLTAISIPASVVNINRNAFNFNQLTSLTVDAANQVYSSPNNCNAVIETSSHKLVVGTRSTVIPSEVTQIASGAFVNMNDLVITIPENISYIEEGAFDWCYNLTVTVKSEAPIDISEWAFYGVDDKDTNSKLRVPAGTKNAYLEALGWNSFLPDNVIEYSSDVIPGDANGDGEVNVTDIVEVVDCIMGRPSANFVREAADVNGDGEVNVTDIVAIVDIIMTSGSSAPKRASVAAGLTDRDVLSLESEGRQELSLSLLNEGEYVASQFDVRLSEGQTLEGITLNGSRMSGHQLTYSEVGSHVYRVVIFSPQNSTYEGNSGELLTMKLSGTGDMEIDNILFITAGQQEKRFATLRLSTTGISAVDKTLKPVDVYTLDGRLVRKQAISLDGLEKGIYIINNKKCIVK